MTEQELYEYYWIKKEIEVLTKQLIEVQSQSVIKGRVYNNIGFGNFTQVGFGKTSNKNTQIKKMMEVKIEELLKRRESIESFINSVENVEIRLILRLRFIDGMSWEEIGSEIGYERSTISKKYRRWVKNPTIHRTQIV